MTARENVAAEMPDAFVRFSFSQRAQHLVMMVSFTLLVLTGLPQKFSGEGWAQALILALGGIETVRSIHRGCALVFAADGLYHVGYIGWLVSTGRFTTAMIPGMRDVTDALNAFRYCVGTEKGMPGFDRYDYRQKFEYWGVALGWLIMVSTGLVMMFPTQATQILPGAFIPTAREMHGGEALLVLLAIVPWHLHGAHWTRLWGFGLRLGAGGQQQADDGRKARSGGRQARFQFHYLQCGPSRSAVG